MENSEAMTHNSLITYHPENFTHGQGEARAVLRVTTLGWPGAYAPLTESGEPLGGWHLPKLPQSRTWCS